MAISRRTDTLQVFNAIYDGTFNLETFSLDSPYLERDVSASLSGRQMGKRSTTGKTAG
jgi:hypothetical protein